MTLRQRADPARRALVRALRKGWTRPFADYAPGDAFAVRDFSEKLRTWWKEFEADAQRFPQKGRLKGEIRKLFPSMFSAGYDWDDGRRLDPDSRNAFEAHWSGLGEFGDRANAALAEETVAELP